MELQGLIDRIKNKDVEALSTLFNKYGASLNGIILRILPSEKQGDEILQQTFSRIWNEMEYYDSSKSTLFTWMSQIARNSALDAKRQNGKESLSNIKNHYKEIDTKNTNSIFINIKSKIAIEKLDKKHRLIIEYVYLRGFTQSQTAEILKIPSSAFKVRLRIAMIELIKLSKELKNLMPSSIVFMTPLIKYLCL